MNNLCLQSIFCLYLPVYHFTYFLRQPQVGWGSPFSHFTEHSVLGYSSNPLFEKPAELRVAIFFIKIILPTQENKIIIISMGTGWKFHERAQIPFTTGL